MWLFYVQLWHTQDFPGGSDGKASAYNVGDPGSIPGSGDLLEKGMATHSSILASPAPHPKKGLKEILRFPGDSEVKGSACSAGDPGLAPGSGRSPGEGNGNPLHYS